VGTEAKTKVDPILLRALNGVCPYYTMFPLSFPLDRLHNAEAGEWVLDPFCGRGSTNYAARLLGLPSIGIDSNPVAVAIAQAKSADTTPARIIATCKRILESTREPQQLPSGAFWKLAFHPYTLDQLCILREALLDDCASPTRQALRALLLGRLHGPTAKGKIKSYCSNQMPRTYASKPKYALGYWRKHGMRPPMVDVLELVTRKAAHYFGHLPAAVATRVLRGDSRTASVRRLLPAGKRVEWVITSPPYYGMRTYVPDQWLRYWFVGGVPKVVYRFPRQLRHESPEAFAGDLSKAWQRAAHACTPGAHLIVRFGTIPERDRDAVAILRESLALAECGWRLTTIKSAGAADRGKRQAKQFGLKNSKPVEEFDFYARLDR